MENSNFINKQEYDIHNLNNALNLAKEALLNAGGAYDALILLGAEKHLPGFSICDDKRKEALKAIDKIIIK